MMIPGWPYTIVAALEPGRIYWTSLLDAVRLKPDDDLAAVTAAEVGGVIGRIVAAGHWHDGDPDIMLIYDAGYERPAGLAAAGSTRAGARSAGNSPVAVAGTHAAASRPVVRPAAARPGAEALRGHRLDRAGRSHHDGDLPVRHRASPRVAPRASKLKARGAWEGHQGKLPVIEGTRIKLTVDHLPHDGDPKPVWLWTSEPAADADELDMVLACVPAPL